MNELDYTLRVYERGEDDLVLMVPHDVNDAWGQTKLEIQARKNKTKQFCNWIRKQYPHVPTEFRYLGKKSVRDYRYRDWSFRTVNCDKHFVAYGLKKSEMLMIKLAWSFKQQVVELAGSDHHQAGGYVVEMADITPTAALIKRLASKNKSEEL